ncbi:MAG: right-handed parallel beta-helix repeat-containing protein, partial [Actinobacteria bacterium]|nr:right-handed parallel beta-helix repeat-containing protein [Actinomycetota bacterium]
TPTVVVAGGTYTGEGNVGWHLTQSVTVMAEPGASVVVSGAEPVRADQRWVDTGVRTVDGRIVWALDGVRTAGGEAHWGRGANAAFPGVGNGVWIADDRPAAALFEQLRLDGTELEQVTAATPLGSLSAGQFRFDAPVSGGLGTVFVAGAVAPFADSVAWTTHRRAFTIEGPSAAGTEIVGIRFERFASTLRDPDRVAYGAGVIAEADRVTLTDVTITQSSGLGLYIGGSGSAPIRGVTLRRVDVTDNGASGIDAHATDALRIESSRIDHNNRSGFNWETADSYSVLAGVKVTRSTGLTVRSSSVSNNRAQGIWLDLYCEAASIEGNALVGNWGTGAFVEISRRVIVRDNSIAGNGAAAVDGEPHRGGVVVGGSREVMIDHNSFAANHDGHVVVYDDDDRTSPGREQGRPGDFPWDPSLTMTANVFVESSDGQQRTLWVRRGGQAASDPNGVASWTAGSGGNEIVRPSAVAARFEVAHGE